MSAGEKVCDRAIAWPRDYRDALFASRVSDNLEAKGTALLKTTKVADEREQFAPKFWKTV